MKRCIAGLGLFTLLAVTSSASALVYNYSDTTFVNANWTGVLYADTSTPPGSFTAAQANPGGSTLGPSTPDYRAITHNFGGGAGGGVNVTHRGNLFNWTPAAGETAATVDYTYDVKFFDPTTPQTFGAVGFAPAIFQGGLAYRLAAYDNVFGPTGWTRFSGTGIPLASFIKMDPSTAGLATGSPNTALAMSFGFVSANSANQFVRKDSGLDNFGMTLNTIVVPEPTTLAAMSVAALVLRRRRMI